MRKNPSFTSFVKEELCEIYQEKQSRDKSLLSAYLRINGSLVFRDKKTNLVFSSENAKIAKLIYKKLKDYYGNDVHLSFSSSFKKKTNYHVTIGEKTESIMQELDISFLEGKIDKELVKNDELISSYLAGAFLACGSINSPLTSNYHLELAIGNENYAKWMLHLFSRYSTSTIEAKLTVRREKTIIYIKKSQQISDFLALIGATNSMMEFENIRIERDFNNSENRLENIVMANMKKTYDAGEKQASEIRFIDEKLGINNIRNEKQRLLCKLRLNNENASLNELAVLMSKELNTTVTKSNINHLFRSLHDLYGRLAK